jgi:hypothetical protein
MSLRNVANIDLFRVGTHNGEEYSLDDLKCMVEAFASAGYQVPVKVGHAEEEGMPAMGWLTKVYLVGDTLVGDMELQPEIYEQVKNRLFDHVSVEIYFNALRDGVTFPKALKAVALLGAETPGCVGLKPLRQATFAAGEYQKIATFTTGVKKMAETVTMAALDEANAKFAAATKELDEAKAFIAKMAMEKRAAEIELKLADCKIPALKKPLSILYSAVHGRKVRCMAAGTAEEMEYDASSALDEIMAMLAKLGKMLKGEMSEAIKPAEELPEEDAGVTIDKMTKKMASEKGINYPAAFQKVLSENPELAKKYANRSN